MTISRRRLIGCALLVLVAGIGLGLGVQRASADKVVTLKTLVLTDVTTITVTRAGAGWTASAGYTVHDGSAGNAKPGMVAVTLTAPQQTTFESFVSSVLVAAANTQEGL